MKAPARQTALTGEHALVDGIAFDMPVDSQDSPALMAGFTVDAEAAEALLPGRELALLRLPRGRALLLVTVILYRTTDIGSYVEYSIALACRHRPAGSSALSTLLREGASTFGQYVWDLPVSTEVSVKGGKGIWGMPKHRAALDFRVDEKEMSSQYDLDGQMCTRVTVRRPGGLRIPVKNLSASNYCQFRGMLMRSRICFSDATELAVGPAAHGSLLLGDSPRMDPLRTLDLSASPLFVACLPHSHGVLDDHAESWFLTRDTAPVAPPEGLESVASLGQGTGWLPPPTGCGR